MAKKKKVKPKPQDDQGVLASEVDSSKSDELLRQAMEKNRRPTGGVRLPARRFGPRPLFKGGK